MALFSFAMGTELMSAGKQLRSREQRKARAIKTINNQ
jgi:hypothetical protein